MGTPTSSAFHKPNCIYWEQMSNNILLWYVKILNSPGLNLLRLYVITNGILACSALTISTGCIWHHFSCRCTAGCYNLLDNCSLWIGAAPREPWGLVLEVTHNHESLLSIHNHCRHVGNAVQLSPLLVVESLAWSARLLPYMRTCCIELHPI